MQATLTSHAANVATTEAMTDIPVRDDLSRNVYCVLGLPIDLIDMPGLLKAVDDAVDRKIPFLISTPNLNFLINSQVNPKFRETLLLSELCSADGMPLVWIARLLRLPIKERVAGADLFEALRARHHGAKQLKMFLFGGADGVARAAASALNEGRSGPCCVGSIYPGYGTVEDMSDQLFISEINSSGADFLLVALGAQKGQAWLLHNHHRLQIPVRAHLGATLNYAAGKFERAPKFAQRLGLEWLWRIKEEPALWRRYWKDGSILFGLLITRALPLALWSLWEKFWRRPYLGLVIESNLNCNNITLKLSGAATAPNIDEATAAFRAALAAKRDITIDFSGICAIDPRFIGLLLMLRKATVGQGAGLRIIGISRRLHTILRLNGVGFLLGSNRSE
jgi:N-acetylglucosaminyldiphosphoundecaprenol N-acetyl-beta-D-mannosaminyltransferase